MNNTPQLEDGFTRIANDILDGLCKIKLSSYQTRVLLYILRKTYGFNKKEDWISVSQIEEATGIYKAHVSRAKKELIERNIVISNGNKVSFQKDSRLWKELPKQVTSKDSYHSRILVTNPGLKVTILGEKLPVQVDTKDTIQKTLTKDSIQKKYSSLKNIDLSVMNEIAKKYQVPLHFVESKFDDMQNWMAAKGKVYKNYKAALMNWVKSDALKIVQKERQTVNKFKVTQL